MEIILALFIAMYIKTIEKNPIALVAHLLLRKFKEHVHKAFEKMQGTLVVYPSMEQTTVHKNIGNCVENGERIILAISDLIDRNEETSSTPEQEAPKEAATATILE